MDHPRQAGQLGDRPAPSPSSSPSPSGRSRSASPARRTPRPRRSTAPPRARPSTAARSRSGLVTKTETNPFFVKMRERRGREADAEGVELTALAGSVRRRQRGPGRGDRGPHLTSGRRHPDHPVELHRHPRCGPDGPGRGHHRDRPRYRDRSGATRSTPPSPPTTSRPAACRAPTSGRARRRRAAADHDGRQRRAAPSMSNATTASSRASASRRATPPSSAPKPPTATRTRPRRRWRTCSSATATSTRCTRSTSPPRGGAYAALEAAGIADDVVIGSIDGGCQGVQDVADGQYAATVMQFPGKMVEQGIDAVDRATSRPARRRPASTTPVRSSSPTCPWRASTPRPPTGGSRTAGADRPWPRGRVPTGARRPHDGSTSRRRTGRCRTIGPDAGGVRHDRELGDDADERPDTLSRLIRTPGFGPAIALAVAVVVFWITTDTFFTASNLSLILQQSIVIGLLALGQTLIVLTAGIDLANGAIAVFGTIVIAKSCSTAATPRSPCCSACWSPPPSARRAALLVTRLALPPVHRDVGDAHRRLRGEPDLLRLALVPRRRRPAADLGTRLHRSAAPGSRSGACC